MSAYYSHSASLGQLLVVLSMLPNKHLLYIHLIDGTSNQFQNLMSLVNWCLQLIIIGAQGGNTLENSKSIMLFYIESLLKRLVDV